MRITLQIDPPRGAAPPVEYRWDPDTDILTATLERRGGREGLTGTIGVQGSDGSWLNFDVSSGAIEGVEVAVWPDLRKVPALEPPAGVEEACVTIPADRSGAGIASVEIESPLSAEADASERTIHFRIGPPVHARTLRLGSDILLDVDGVDRLTGLWLLNVPPFPEAEP